MAVQLSWNLSHQFCTPLFATCTRNMAAKKTLVLPLTMLSPQRSSMMSGCYEGEMAVQLSWNLAGAGALVLPPMSSAALFFTNLSPFFCHLHQRYGSKKTLVLPEMWHQRYN